VTDQPIDTIWRETTPLIVDPLVIVGTPRSGTSTLHATLSSHPTLWSLYAESLTILDGPMHPRNRGWESHALTERDLTNDLRASLQEQFFRRLGNLEVLPVGRLVPLRGRGKPYFTRMIASGSKPFKRAPIRMVEKTIPNILRTRFLAGLFRGCRVLHLTRHPRTNVAAMYRGWRDPRRHHDFPLPQGFELVGHPGRYWSFVLPPGWQSQNGKSLMEVCAFQWAVCHKRCIDDTASFDRDRYLQLHLEDLLENPVDVLRQVAAWAEVDPRPFERFSRGLPRINYRKEGPKASVPWNEVESVLPSVSDVATRLGYS
jgi:hypothetical protein